MRQSVLNKCFAVSLLFHAGLFGLLVLEASRRPLFSDTPLRVRILGPPTSQPLPDVGSRPELGRRPVEASRPSTQTANPQLPTERLLPRPLPVPDRPVAPVPTPQVAAPPPVQAATPPIEKAPGPLREARIPPPPERSGLTLGGPREAAPSLPGARGAPPSSAPSRPSLREQIASLGSGLTGDVGGTAKRTINLDSREEYFVDYLGRLKWRVQQVWKYPEEAVRHGISGELLIVFTLNKMGSLTYIRLVQSSGYPILDEEALRAVKLAAPFDPFSSQMGDDPLNINASFHYDLPRWLRRN